MKVNREQILLLKVYLPLALVIILLDNLFPGRVAVYYFKFVTVLTLFPVALLTGKCYREQAILTFSVFLMVVGDFLLNLCSAIPDLAGDVRIFGVLSFILAYLSLLAVFMRGRIEPGPGKYLALAPVLAVLLPAVAAIAPHVEEELLTGALIFTLVLGLMAWAAICTLFRGYYRGPASFRFALAGCLMLISDIGVANNVFNPDYSAIIVPWLQNIIWGTYIPAWSLIAVNIADDHLVA